MAGKTLFKSISLQNILSFGGEEQTIALEPLNVLIGPNGSGKSNLLEILGLLRSCPKDLTVPIREGGGIDEWMWKGVGNDKVSLVKVYVERGEMEIHHCLKFESYQRRINVRSESIVVRDSGTEEEDRGFTYSYEGDGFGEIIKVSYQGANDRETVLENLKNDQSILSQLKNPERYPWLSILESNYSGLKIYKPLALGNLSELKKHQPTDLPEDFLLEDGSNLALILNDFDHRRMKPVLLEELRRFNEFAEDFTTKVFGNQILLYLHEKGLNKPIPATRLSDGTLNYLALLAILCHPDPPPLICIEEPEVGMHPDIIPEIAKLLVEASAQTQLVVTTHSTDLVSALSDTPEAILVCERHESGTQMRRLDPERLGKWLEDYSLGDLWRSGEIGGNQS